MHLRLTNNFTIFVWCMRIIHFSWHILHKFCRTFAPHGFSNFLWHFGIENTSIISNLHVKCPSVELKWPLCHLVFGLLTVFHYINVFKLYVNKLCNVYVRSCKTYFPRCPTKGLYLKLIRLFPVINKVTYRETSNLEWWKNYFLEFTFSGNISAV